MNGWKKLGIVFTALYFIGISGYGIYSYSEAKEIESKSKASTFYLSYKHLSESEKVSVLENRKKMFDLCVQESKPEDLVFCEAIFLFEPNYSKKLNGVDIAILLVIIPSLGWLIAWFIVAVIKWVVRGFKSA